MKNLKLLGGAILVSLFLIPIGIIWNLGKSIYNLLKYWFFILVQLFVVFRYLLTRQKVDFFFKIAYSLDLIWNVTAGEFLEDCLTNNEQTKFGQGNITVSASTGKEVESGDIAKRGRWFVSWLDRIFNEKDHCLNAWNKWKAKK